jgi:hypothetical protein
MDLFTIIGTLASLAGLGLSLYVLHVAIGARSAARDARVLGRKRNLAEELERSSKYIEQVGIYLQKREWMAAQIRAHEIMTSCMESLTRWPEGLSKDRKNDVRTASTLVHSLADEAASPEVNDFTTTKLKRLSGTQRQVAALLSSALGEALKRAERHGE